MKKIVSAALLIASTAVLLLLLHHYTGTVCLINSFFGIPCPGCGMTRAALLLFRLDFEGSFKMHPLFIPAAAVLLACGIAALKKRPLGKLKIPVFVMAGLMSVFYIIRMVTLFPHTEPMNINGSSLLLRILSLFQ